MSVLVRVGVDICIQLSTVSSCLAGQVNNNNNMLSNELEREKEKITTNLEVTAFPCCRALPAQRCSDQKSMIIVVPSCLKDADGACIRSDQKKLD